MRSLAITNAKGGVGKSTTAINLAAALADQGRRVLLVDADPSGNATLGFVPTGVPARGLADVLLEGVPFTEAAIPSGVERLDLVPPGNRLGLCSDQMGGSQGLGQGREFRIRRALRTLTDYELVLFDTSPVLTPLNVAILYAAGEIIIPIDPCIAALAGVKALEDLVRDVAAFREEMTDGGAPAIRAVLITRTDRTLVSRQVESEVRAYFGPIVFERPVPTSVKFREAYARGIPLVHYDPACAGAAAYREAAAALLQQADDAGKHDDAGAITVDPTAHAETEPGRIPLVNDEDDDATTRSAAPVDGDSSEERGRGPHTPHDTRTQHSALSTQRERGTSHEQSTRRTSRPREPDKLDPARDVRGRVRAPACQWQWQRQGRLERRRRERPGRDPGLVAGHRRRRPGRRAGAGPAPSPRGSSGTSRGRGKSGKSAKARRVERMFAIEEDLDKKLWLYAIHLGKDRSEVINDLLRPIVSSMVLYDSRDRRASRSNDSDSETGGEGA